MKLTAHKKQLNMLVVERMTRVLILPLHSWIQRQLLHKTIRNILKQSSKNYKVSNSNNIPYGWLDSKAWLIGGNYAFTPQFRVGLQYSEINASDEAVAGTPYNKKSKYTVITAHYSLSKRTYLFSTFGHADNGIAPIAPLWGGSQVGQQVVRGDSINGFVVGMVHRF